MLVKATKSRIWIVGFVLISLCAVVLLCGCAGDNKAPIPAGKYIAIEEHLEVGSTLINGTYPFPFHAPNPMSALSIEWFREANSASGSTQYQSFRPYYFPAVNDSLVILWGKSSHVDSPPTQDNLDLTIAGIYSLPYTGASGFIVERIGSDGTIFGSHKNRTIALKNGEQWSSATISETIPINDSYYVTYADGNSEERPYAYIYTQNTAWTVKNLGMYDKTNLTRYSYGP